MENTQNKNEYAFGLIIDEMDGVITKEGKRDLQQWISADAENERIYREFYTLHDRMSLFAAQKDLDAEASWRILEEKLDDETLVPLRAKGTFRSWLAIAAVIAVFSTIGLYFTVYQQNEQFTTAANERKTIALPDGSSVTLNENTVLSYNKYQFKNSRKLALLKGEAFFSVFHDPQHQFSVDLGKTQVTDIGTSFNIFRAGDKIKVVVNTGSVSVENKITKQKEFLSGGSKVTYTDARNGLTKTANDDVNYKSWFDKKLTFRNTPLSEVTGVLEKTYGCKVLLKDSELKDRKLVANLNYQTADSALLVISETLHLKLKYEGKKYSLSN